MRITTISNTAYQARHTDTRQQTEGVTCDEGEAENSDETGQPYKLPSRSLLPPPP
jgi:hypothetical protein